MEGRQVKTISLISGILMATTLSISPASAQPRQTYTYVVNNGTGWTIDVIFGGGGISATWRGGGRVEYWHECINQGGEAWLCNVRGDPNAKQHLGFSADNRTLRQGNYIYHLQS